MPASAVPPPSPPLLPPASGAGPLPPGRGPSRTLHLAAAIDGRDQYTAAYYVELARLAEHGALDFVTLGTGACADIGGAGAAADGCGGGGGGGQGGRGGGGGDVGRGGALDAFAVLARVAPDTDRIGLLPLAAAAGSAAELGLAVATLDWVSHGRAGWAVADPPGPSDLLGPAAAAAPVRPARAGGGRRHAASPRLADRDQARWLAAAAVTDTVAREWGGFGAPPAPHSPRPRPGRPVIALDATDAAAHPTAARHADVAFVRTAHPDRAADLRTELRRRAAESGRDPERLLVLADLRVDLCGGELGPEPGAEIVLATDPAGTVRFRGGPVDLAELIAAWHRAGAVDGFHIHPLNPRRDLERFVNGTVALLQHRGLFRSFHPGSTLREHLGLNRPERRLTAVAAGGPAS